MQFYSIKKEEWDKTLRQLISSHTIFATVSNGYGHDYELINETNIENISYNNAKPATPLKNFFLPFREDVTSENKSGKQLILIGVPNCDIESLDILDLIYLDKDFNDIHYNEKRKNTLLISTDCVTRQEHCHCTAYGIKPFAERIADISLMTINDDIVLHTISDKGVIFLKQISGIRDVVEQNIKAALEKNHSSIIDSLNASNRLIPGYSETGKLVALAADHTWKEYSKHCVSCGACSAICPTCSCFLLIEKPGFEKVKQQDSCQYPGFERVAGGEDALFELDARFRNRYMCKYLWKPKRYDAKACTGCGRCIEACLGKINKNEIFIELSSQHADA